MYFADAEPQGLMKSFDARLPHSAKVGRPNSPRSALSDLPQLGLLASSTPFVTGRPYTLITGKEIYSTGAVGLAVCRYPARPSSAITIDYNQLQPLGDALEVTVSVPPADESSSAEGIHTAPRAISFWSWPPQTQRACCWNEFSLTSARPSAKNKVSTWACFLKTRCAPLFTFDKLDSSDT